MIITPEQREALEKHSHRWRVVDLLTGVAFYPVEREKGGGLVSSILSFHAAPVKDYYPRCISTTTTFINPILLLPHIPHVSHAPSATVQGFK